ncbi:aromatic ring-hydroxylating oxygenase subunit alpha [Aneurinibacillus tyrosinisolvens]|uniref:aromatic ring-hydroxylating oxygenase subunit alpha n=1 Tax=Aneurinibacillus tyrosinisolvens TaxID=1443435 RepID=UPI00063EE890|nr:aromatic ring-hydroxylating dioxygenase subunit alpha [Aneurinibacillus tyrosinisolvens]
MPVKEKNNELNQTKTMPYYLYSDPKVLPEEQEKIFAKSWQYVGHVSQIQKIGDYFTCEVAGEPLIIVRGKDDQIRAFYNVCPHRATKLEKNSEGNKKILQCGYHGWTFNLDGSLNKAPNFKDTGSFCEGGACLRSIRLEIQTSMIFVNLDDHAVSLSASYGDFFDSLKDVEFLGELKKVWSKSRVIKGNWKAFMDNYLECDHCPIAHPSFVATLDMSQYKVIACDNYSVQGTIVKPDKTLGSIELNKAEFQGGRFYWLWPNMAITIYPGTGNLTVIRMIPIDHETTLGVYDVFFRDENLTKEDEELLQFMEQVRDEDIELIELAQIGFNSKAFKRGVLSPTENGVFQFHKMVSKALGITE